MNPEIQQYLDDARALEQRMRAAQSALEQATVEGRSADGTVTVTAGGLGRLRSVQVDPEVFDHRDARRLAAAIAEAVQAAGANARILAEQRLGPIEIALH